MENTIFTSVVRTQQQNAKILRLDEVKRQIELFFDASKVEVEEDLIDEHVYVLYVHDRISRDEYMVSYDTYSGIQAHSRWSVSRFNYVDTQICGHGSGYLSLPRVKEAADSDYLAFKNRVAGL